ncbi:hypothetical protein ILFOPFJJ_03993 [Ensifer psoraleae]|nr:hypothetical protein [Sinorhizobium psoraleae]
MPAQTKGIARGGAIFCLSLVANEVERHRVHFMRAVGPLAPVKPTLVAQWTSVKQPAASAPRSQTTGNEH